MRLLKSSIIGFTAIIAAVSCQDYTPFWGEEGTGELKPSSDYFSFNTTREIDLSVDYGTRGSQALIEVYTENPTYIGEDGNTYFHDDAVFKAYCDENGRFEGKVSLPTYVNNVYVYTMRVGVPQLVSADVKNGAVTMNVANTVSIKNEETPPPGYSETGREFADPVVTTKDEKNNREYKIWKAPTNTGQFLNPNKVNIYTIVNWDGQRFGRIIPTHYYDIDKTCYYIEEENGKYYDNQGLIGEDENTVNPFTAKDIDNIQQFLWNGATTKPNGLDNTRFYEGIDTEDINTTIPHSYIKNGSLTPVDSAQVWLRFLGEGAWYADGLAYYYYPTDTPPQTRDDIKAYYVAIPNTSSTAQYVDDDTFLGRTVPFVTYKDIDTGKSTLEYINDKGGSVNFVDENNNRRSAFTYNPKFVPFDINQRVQLLYHGVDKDGNPKVSRYFPPGITIGFLLFYDPAKSSDNFARGTMCINCWDESFHSDWRLNNGSKQRRYIALNYKNMAVYGVEDSGVNGDNSMEDVLFSIETDPIGLVVNQNRPTIEDNNEQTESKYRTYAFEDIWPDGGDYDINDVVIEHYHSITFTFENKVTRIEDSFTAVHPGKTADYVDAFAIQLPSTRPGRTLTLYKNEVAEGNKMTEGVDYYEEDCEDGTKNLILFTHIMKQQYQTVIVVRDFTDGDGNPLGDIDKQEVSLEQTETVNEEEITYNVLNPFIISQYDRNKEEGRTEIHLPKHSPTMYGKNADGGAPTYYIKNDGIHPFALSLPVGVVSGRESRRFKVELADEGKRIEEVYPDFENWVKAAKANDPDKLERYGDWYLYYGTSKDPK